MSLNCWYKVCVYIPWVWTVSSCSLSWAKKKKKEIQLNNISFLLLELRHFFLRDMEMFSCSGKKMEVICTLKLRLTALKKSATASSAKRADLSVVKIFLHTLTFAYWVTVRWHWEGLKFPGGEFHWVTSTGHLCFPHVVNLVQKKEKKKCFLSLVTARETSESGILWVWIQFRMFFLILVCCKFKTFQVSIE